MSINKVILLGRVSNDITVNKTQSGTSICNFSLAVDRYMGKDKEKATDFIRCNAFGTTADTLGKYAKKGKQIAIEGNIKTGSYEKDGVKHYTQDVQVDRVELLGGNSENTNNNSQPAQQQTTPKTEEAGLADYETISGEEVPF